MLNFVLYELKRVALGEFMDDIDIGDTINEALGMPPSELTPAEEQVGEERLGTGSVG